MPTIYEIVIGEINRRPTMKVTYGSTSLDDQHLERRLDPELWKRTKLLLDELQQLRAKQSARDAILNSGRLKRSHTMRALLEAAIANNISKLERETPANRTRKLLEHIRIRTAYYAEHHGLEILPDGSARLPNRKLVKEVLKAHGL
jgi:hypothetical protein